MACAVHTCQNPLHSQQGLPHEAALSRLRETLAAAGLTYHTSLHTQEKRNDGLLSKGSHRHALARVSPPLPAQPLTVCLHPEPLDMGPPFLHVCDEDFESHSPGSVSLDKEHGLGVECRALPSSALKLPCGSRKVIRSLWGLGFLIYTKWKA